MKGFQRKKTFAKKSKIWLKFSFVFCTILRNFAKTMRNFCLFFYERNVKNCELFAKRFPHFAVNPVHGRGLSIAFQVIHWRSLTHISSFFYFKSSWVFFSDLYWTNRACSHLSECSLEITSLLSFTREILDRPF